jgi:hypothetical protein
LLDYLISPPLREDVFVRGPRLMTPLRQNDWLQQVGLALIVPRDTVALDMTSATGMRIFKPELCVPLLDALAQQPRTLAELAAMPELKGPRLKDLLEVAAMLVMHKQAATYFSGTANISTDAAHRMNRALALQARYHDNYKALASPLLGNGVIAGQIQRLVYLALVRQPEKVDADAIINEVVQVMAAQGARITARHEPMELEVAEISKTVKAILQRRIPIWRQLRVL